MSQSSRVFKERMRKRMKETGSEKVSAVQEVAENYFFRPLKFLLQQERQKMVEGEEEENVHFIRAFHFRLFLVYFIFHSSPSHSLLLSLSREPKVSPANYCRASHAYSFARPSLLFF